MNHLMSSYYVLTAAMPKSSSTSKWILFPPPQLQYNSIPIPHCLSFPSKFLFFNTIFVSSHMYPENPEGIQVIVGSMNMGYISDTARNRTHNLFGSKREPTPLGHNDGHFISHLNFNCINPDLFSKHCNKENGSWNRKRDNAEKSGE